MRRVAQVSDLDDLEKKIALMRKLGVTEVDGIKLGPVPQEPAKEETAEEYTARLNRETARRHEIMFAASATRPRLRVLK